MIFWDKLKIQNANANAEIQLTDQGTVSISDLDVEYLSVNNLVGSITLPAGSKFRSATELPTGTSFAGPITIPTNSVLAGMITLPSTSTLTASGELRVNQLSLKGENASADFRDATVSFDGSKTMLNNLSLSDWIGNAVNECRCEIPNGVAVVCAWDNDVYVHPLLPRNLQLRAIVNGNDSPWSWNYNNDKGWVATGSGEGNTNKDWSHIDNVTNIKFELISDGQRVAGSNSLTITRANWDPTGGSDTSSCYFIPINLFFNNGTVPSDYSVNYYCPGPVAATATAVMFMPLNFTPSSFYNRASLIAWALDQGYNRWKGVYFIAGVAANTGTKINRSIANTDASTSYTVYGFTGLSRYTCDESNVGWYDSSTFYKE